jgi:hypothetical protein
MADFGVWAAIRFGMMMEDAMKGTNFLANIFDWVGDTFERLSPAMFRMLSTVLPYLTPLPVAWLTAKHAAQFLGFTSEISVVFVVMLEGIGLWATTELVDAFVEAVRSKNWKSWGVVAFLSVVVIAYVTLLISLNVTLQKAAGNTNPTMSYVLTLICFLPLIAGCLNGYRKVKLETKTQMHLAKEHQEALDAQIRQEQMDFKLKRAGIKAGFNPFAPQPTVTLNADTSQVKEVKEKHASDYREKAIDFIVQYHEKNRTLPSPKHLTERFNLEHSKNKGYMSSLIKTVSQDRGW